MYNLFKLQKHDAFYKSREGWKCSIKYFNAENAMPYVEGCREYFRLLSTDGWMDGQTHNMIPKA